MWGTLTSWRILSGRASRNDGSTPSGRLRSPYSPLPPPLLVPAAAGAELLLLATAVVVEAEVGTLTTGALLDELKIYRLLSADQQYSRACL